MSKNSFYYQKKGNKKNALPPIDHKFTKEDYSDMRRNVFKQIEQVDEVLTPHFNSVKQRIIQMAVDNIENAITQYFNETTYRASPRQAEIFLKSSKELLHIAHFIPNSEEKTEIINYVKSKLNEIRSTFADQYQYLKELEKEVQNLKNTQSEAQNIW